MIGHRIAALDLSLTGTGIAVREPDGTVHTRTVDGTRLTGQRRLHEILAAVADLRDCAVVVIEDYNLGALKGKAALQVVELQGLVRHWLWLRDVPVVLAQPAQLKLYALGKGGGPNSGKEAVLLAVERRYGLLAAVGDNNQADALVLLAIALEHYGHPLAPVPATHRAALAKIQGWPDLPTDPTDSPSPAETQTPAGAGAALRSIP